MESRTKVRVEANFLMWGPFSNRILKNDTLNIIYEGGSPFSAYVFQRRDTMLAFTSCINAEDMKQQKAKQTT